MVESKVKYGNTVDYIMVCKDDFKLKSNFIDYSTLKSEQLQIICKKDEINLKECILLKTDSKNYYNDIFHKKDENLLIICSGGYIWGKNTKKH